jgi:hypothetical protein
MRVTEVDDVAWVRVRRSTFRRREFKAETLPHVRATGVFPPVVG